MAWISVTATRPNMAANIAGLRKVRLDSGIPSVSEANLVAAWVGGDEATIAEEEDILLHCPPRMPRLIQNPPSYKLGTVAAWPLLRRCEGADVDGELRALAEATGHKEWLPRASGRLHPLPGREPSRQRKGLRERAR